MNDAPTFQPFTVRVALAAASYIERHGITRGQLASMSGVYFAVVKNLLDGNYKPLRATDLEKIVDAITRNPRPIRYIRGRPKNMQPEEQPSGRNPA